MQPQFSKYQRTAKRAAKIHALDALGTAEARARRKEMNVHKVRRERSNLTGFYGIQRVKCKVTSKSKSTFPSIPKEFK